MTDETKTWLKRETPVIVPLGVIVALGAGWLYWLTNGQWALAQQFAELTGKREVERDEIQRFMSDIKREQQRTNDKLDRLIERGVSE